MEEPEETGHITHRITLVKRELPLDVPWQIELSNGEVHNGSMNARDTVRVVEVETSQNVRIVRVRMDPERQVPIDLDRSNNRYETEPDGTRQLGTGVLYLITMEWLLYVL